MSAISLTSNSSLLRFPREHKRWGIVALLYFFSVMSNLDRQSVSVLAPTLKQALHFGSVEYSYIVSGFLLAYALGYAFCGGIIDRFGVKRTLAVALVCWSLAAMAHSLATGWIGLLLCRILLGLGESFNVPAGIKAITQWIPVRERGLCIALFSNGHVTGAILAPPAIVFLTYHFGWNWSFVATGGLGLLLATLWWKFYHAPERHPSITPAEKEVIDLSQRGEISQGALPRVTVIETLKNPLTLCFIFVQFLTDPISFFLSFWLPDYLQQSRGLTLTMIGLIGWLPFLGSDLGGPGGGAASDWLVRRGWNSGTARRFLMLGAAFLMLLSNVAVRTETLWLSIFCIGLMFAAQSIWKANLFTLIAETTPRRNIATVVALAAFGGAVGGVVANLAAGRVIATYGYRPVFTALGSLPFLALIMMELVLRRVKARAE